MLILKDYNVPDHWDRLHDQVILGVDYVWYTLNPIAV